MKSLLLGLGCFWLRTLRVRWISPESLPDRAVILLWHEHLPACIRVFSHRDVAVLISQSSDGDWAAEACSRFGYRVHRGSTSRGGAAGMRSLARSLETKNPYGQATSSGLAGMALDGPRGPRRRIKPGAIWLSRLNDIPVIPVFIHARFAFRLDSWDRCLVPFPFSTVEVRVGIPFNPTGIEEIERAMEALEHPLSSKDFYIPASQPV